MNYNTQCSVRRFWFPSVALCTLCSVLRTDTVHLVGKPTHVYNFAGSETKIYLCSLKLGRIGLFLCSTTKVNFVPPWKLLQIFCRKSEGEKKNDFYQNK